MVYRHYGQLADDLYRTCLISDPWLEGRERFGLTPILLDAATYDRMSQAAEAIGRLYEEFTRMVLDEPHRLDSFFNLTPYQKLMWLASHGQWHGIARLDTFILNDGSIRVCEMNSDTPSGEAEAVVLNRLFHEGSASIIDPNADFEERFCSMVLAGSGDRPTVGIVYPTEMPEDLSMIRMYQGWLESRGCRVRLGSPYNLLPTTDGRVTLFDTPLDILFRHYKTDWWSEREVVWTDEEPFPDAEPLAGPLRHVLNASLNGRVVLINPFGSVITQNKLSMAFFWRHLERFSDEGRETIRAFIPETVRLADVDAGTLRREEWVLKSDYGCEGDDVIVGHAVSEAVWQESLEKAVRHRWILQRYFEAAPTYNGLIPNYGLYLIAGEAAGIYTRLSSSVTDHTSVSAATFLSNSWEKPII